MRRAGVGSGSHGGNIGGFQNEKSGRTGAAAGGRDIKNDRNLRCRNLLDDLAGGFDQAAGGIDFDQQGLVVAAPGFVDGAGDVFLSDGLNGVIDDDLEDLRRRSTAGKPSPGFARVGMSLCLAFEPVCAGQEYFYSYL
jgi:hypothetical protein